ncbi:hypothetical protein VE01_02023 [Pseudogymnoascus verrucosus]|uniref:Uncharacterized protein n=1 Tax=Pseudogymnoascus verrucosus TaxID=342668 RepID=A0A1B8GV98_9PEZI|nr:uncharacterized protein VE01_02023 [Pseudogymnoascus verrucosus]OBT99746.1 hypothetical protein VE01_02023 [Pseudogymnoascus verrucosus]
MDPAVKTPDLKVQEPIHLSTIYESQTEDAFKPASTASKVPEAPTGQTTTRESSISKTSSSAITPEAPAAEVQAKAQVEDETQAQAGQERSVPSLFSLAGKIIIVTGAARDIGLTMSESLVECGAIAPAPSSTASPPLPKGTLTYHPIDVVDVPALDTLVTSIAGTHSRLHGLIAAAGIQHEAPALTYSAETCNRVLAVNITGVMSSAQAVAHAMRQAGVQQLGRSLAAEWGREGIRVNTISPGYVVTQMVEELFEKFPERRDGWAGENMLGRLGKPGDLGGAGVFLMAGCSGWMTGGDLRIDGGNTAW